MRAGRHAEYYRQLRAAVAETLLAGDFDSWLISAEEPVLLRLAAPLEMLQFQYERQPPQDQHLLRAARVCCEAASSGLAGCPPSMVRGFEKLARIVQTAGP